MSPDEFGYVTPTGTLWSWPGQNPIAFADPEGLGLAPGDERGPLVFILEMMGLGDTATVIVEHQNSLDSIMAGNVAAAECSADKIMAASASLAASAAAAVVAGAAVKGVGKSVPWSTRTVRRANRALDQGATSVKVGSRSEAEELFLARFQGAGYRNATGLSATEAKGLFGQKAGTYHWDIGARAFPHESSHLQVHTHAGDVIRIFFP